MVETEDRTKVRIETGLQQHQVFAVMTALVEGHVFQYGKMLKKGIKPALAKSALADQLTVGTDCCSGGTEKLSCAVHHLAWAYVTSVEALWNATAK